MNASSSVAIVVVALATSCAHRLPEPIYYKIPVAEMVADARLDTVLPKDSVDTDLLEWAVFYETNYQRALLGISHVKYEPRLQQAARQHSREMVELEYFDHTSPVSDYETVRQRLHHAGIRHGIGGENIAIHPMQKKQEIVFKVAGAAMPARTSWRNQGKQYTYREFARDLVRRWLNSAAHRHNILNPRFLFLGVGAVRARYGESDVFFVTQNFSSTNF